MLEALVGYAYDAAKGTLRFQPQLDRSKFRCLFVAKGGWGVYSQALEGSRQVCRIELRYGSLELVEMRVPQLLKKPKSLSVLLGRNVLKGASIWSRKGQVIVKGDIRMLCGQALLIVAERR